jgi:hypothetical protein
VAIDQDVAICDAPLFGGWRARKVRHPLDAKTTIIAAMAVKSVKMSQYNDAVWNCLKLYLPPLTTLSCVYRTDEDQLQIVVNRATDQGYRFSRPPRVSDQASWLAAWHLVNTRTDPVARPGRSTHRLGIAYDLGGPDLPKIVTAIQKAASVGAIRLASLRPGWDNPRLEGHCVHVEILGGRMDFEAFDFA